MVPIDGSDDDFCGRALQHGTGHVLIAASGHGAARARLVPRLVLVRSEVCPVWLGAPGDWPVGLGLFHLERSPAEGQGLVHAQAADVLAGRGRSSLIALVDSGAAAARAVLPYG